MPDPLTVFLATAIGVGASGQAEPGLVDPSPALAGHLEVGVEWSESVSIALATALARSWYDNTVPPPDGVSPGDSLVLSRAGLGLVVEGRVPLTAAFSLAGGGAAYLNRVSARARGSVLGVGGDYYEDSDVGPAVEARAGADLRLGGAVQLGLRGGWMWYGADLPEVTDGSVELGGPSVELRLAIDISDLRMDPVR